MVRRNSVWVASATLWASSPVCCATQGTDSHKQSEETSACVCSFVYRVHYCLKTTLLLKNNILCHTYCVQDLFVCGYGSGIESDDYILRNCSNYLYYFFSVTDIFNLLFSVQGSISTINEKWNWCSQSLWHYASIDWMGFMIIGCKEIDFNNGEHHWSGTHEGEQRWWSCLISCVPYNITGVNHLLTVVFLDKLILRPLGIFLIHK